MIQRDVILEVGRPQRAPLGVLGFSLLGVFQAAPGSGDMRVIKLSGDLDRGSRGYIPRAP